MRYVLELAYNGSAYHGWQIQPNSISVQEEVNKALNTLFQSDINVAGCGRTDTGVHATQYFCHFDADFEFTDVQLFKLNQILPKDIVVYQFKEVAERFHTRFDATYRKYIYQVHFVKNPFIIGKSLFLYKKPNFELMNEACKILLNHNDFASFCKSGADNKTTLCKLTVAYWEETETGYQFVIQADRFLRNMVRAVVGTLLDIGLGKTDIKDLENIIKAKNRSASGKSVAAHGLYLAEVGYNW